MSIKVYYDGQSPHYKSSDKTIHIDPDNNEIIISNDTLNKVLRINSEQFSNGVQNLRFSDIYTTVNKTDAIKYPPTDPLILDVKNTVRLYDDNVVENITTLTNEYLQIEDVNTYTKMYPSYLQLHDKTSTFDGYIRSNGTTVEVDTIYGNTSIGDVANTSNGVKVFISNPHKNITLSCVDLLSGQWQANPLIVPINYTGLYDTTFDYNNTNNFQEIASQYINIPTDQLSQTEGHVRWKVDFHTNMRNMTHQGDKSLAFYIELRDNKANSFKGFTFNIDTPYTEWKNISNYSNTSTNSENYGWIDYFDLTGATTGPINVVLWAYGDTAFTAKILWNITLSKTNNVSL